MAKTLVTGATGFIGSHLARALARAGRRAAPADPAGLRRRRRSTGIDFERVNGDVTDRRAVRRAVDGVDRVFHVAGMTSMRAADADRVFDVNLGGTRIVAEEALRRRGRAARPHVVGGGDRPGRPRAGGPTSARRSRPAASGSPT